jgi:hypothetical protein
MNSHRESQRMLPSVLCARSRKTHLYQFPFISNQAAKLVTVPSWIVSIFILAALSIYFCMNSSGGENITKSSKTLTFPMIVRASVAECLVRFASVLQISRWKLRHPTEAVLGTLYIGYVWALHPQKSPLPALFFSGSCPGILGPGPCFGRFGFLSRF